MKLALSASMADVASDPSSLAAHAEAHVVRRGPTAGPGELTSEVFVVDGARQLVGATQRLRRR